MKHAESRSASALGLLLLIAAATSAVGCEGDDADQSPPLGFRDAAASSDGAPNDGQADGGATVCGDEDGLPCGDGRHCLRGRCELNTCGDGVQAGDELCDDGNLARGDGCDPACRPEPTGCGNGELEDGEECDDGNWVDEDSCSNDCLSIECGNQRTEREEECDDGNTVDDDTCSNACTIVECRNGRLDPGEECDDGNTVHRDGCTNACKIAICGNGRIEEYEMCDDGNQNDMDACPNSCIPGECGNGVIEPGEACDGSRVVQSSMGESWDCSTDCSEKLPYACGECEGEFCSQYLELDLIAGCYEEVDPQFGAAPGDPNFIQECLDVINCARANHCAYDEVKRAAGCYCGSRNPDECAATGPAEDAPCVAEWQAAARSLINADVQNRFTDLAFPVGWAYLLLDCHRESCSETCIPAAPAGP